MTGVSGRPQKQLSSSRLSVIPSSSAIHCNKGSGIRPAACPQFSGRDNHAKAKQRGLLNTYKGRFQSHRVVQLGICCARMTENWLPSSCQPFRLYGLLPFQSVSFFMQASNPALCCIVITLQLLLVTTQSIASFHDHLWAWCSQKAAQLYLILQTHRDLDVSCSVGRLV